MRDQQRQRVYKFGWSLPEGKRLTLEECIALIEKICLKYGIRPPRVKDGRGTTYARASSYLVNLPKWARTERTVLHEISHTICQTYQTHGSWHGPEFVRLFHDLLLQYKVAERSELREALKIHKVKMAPSHAAVKPVSWKDKLGEEMDLLAQKYVDKFHLKESEVKMAMKKHFK